MVENIVSSASEKISRMVRMELVSLNVRASISNQNECCEWYESVEIGNQQAKRKKKKKLSDREELTQFKKTTTFREEGILSAKHPCTNISQREDVEIRFLVAQYLS